MNQIISSFTFTFTFTFTFALMPLVRLAAHRWRWLRCSLHRALTAGLSLLSALLLVALAGWPLGGQSATSFSLHTRVVLAARKQGALRCARIRHEVSGGVVQYALRDGDPELRALVRPLFPAKENEKRLVVWSADHHIGPISDLRSIFEPLGVKFLEHTLYHACDVMCTCDQLRNTRVLDKDNIFRVDDRLVRRFWSAYADDADLQRADALLVSYSFQLLEIFQHYNESIIAIAPLRYDYPLQSQPAHWLALNEILHAVHMNPHNVLGANNLYDAEYIRYFTGLRVDYVPSFCGYTGEFYNPLRRSFLYSDRRLNLGPRLGPIWNSRFDATYTQLNASFKIENYRAKYHQFEYRDLATHLGIVYIPYQVSHYPNFIIFKSSSKHSELESKTSAYDNSSAQNVSYEHTF